MHPWLLLSLASYYCTLESGVTIFQPMCGVKKDDKGFKKYFLGKQKLLVQRTGSR